MKRANNKIYVVYALVLFVVAAPMAWALDTHDSGFADKTKVAICDIGFSSQQVSHDIDQSDHCDHGLAHLMTLVSSETPMLNLSVSKIGPACDGPFITISAIPPYRPPVS